jgi:hypothetical protein
MMKKSAPLLLLLSLLTLFSCEQDLYEKGDNEYSYMRADFVEAVVGSDKQVVYVVTDNDERLLLTAPYTDSWIGRSDTVYRAILYYSNQDDRAKVELMGRVSTLSIKTDSVSVGTWKEKLADPLGLETAWVSFNKKYLNLGLVLRTGAVDDESKIQKLGMHYSSSYINADSTRTVHLLLSHNQGEVPEYYSQRVYVSVPISEVPTDTLRVSINTYNGVVTKNFRLTPLKTDR